MYPGDIEHAASHAEGTSENVDIEQPSLDQHTLSFRQARKRWGGQSMKEISLGSVSSIPEKPKQGSWFLCGCKLRQRTSTLSFMARAVALLVGLMVVFHAASCGYFFCMSFPGNHVLGFSRDLYEDFRDIYALAGGPIMKGSEIYKTPGIHQPRDRSPKLIPKTIHQTYRSSNVPQAIRPLMQSWQIQNPDWSFRFYDDEACLDFVKREFPEYLDAYKGLAKNVERSDFFRYMVVLRLGGVYADVDTECKLPMDNLILPKDTLIVSWENEFSTAEEARQRKYVRKRQILQWVFAGAPGHPALREICDRIARTILEPIDKDTNLDTLERTGPGLWTDIVLKHARLHPTAKKTDPFNVRIMPKVIFGAHPLGYDGLAGDDPGVVVLHHFLGSWKMRSIGLKKWSEALKTWLSDLLYPQPITEQPLKPPAPTLQGMEKVLPRDLAAKQLYPVDINWHPHFTMLVDLVGHGDLQSGSDVAATLTAYGTWQPALLPHRSPSVGDALIGSLGGKGSSKRVFVDVGAGIGLFSMMAAARGHKVMAFEMARNSLESFNASLAYNGFQDLVEIHQVALGHVEEVICLDPEDSLSREASMELVQLSRGYGPPSIHSNRTRCVRRSVRQPASLLIPEDTDVGAIRISVSGWEGWVWEGFKDVIRRSKPGVVMIELHPNVMEEVGYGGGAVKLLQEIYNSGYMHVSHSGLGCDERWMDITRSIRLKGGMQVESLKQPTWCQLQPEQFSNIVQRASTKFPENILFTRQTVEGASHVIRTARTEGNIQLQQQDSDRDFHRDRSRGYTIGDHSRSEG